MPQMITGELRKWRRDTMTNGDPCVVGTMYNDTQEIWEDGEEAVIRYGDWYESANYYLAVTIGGGCIKCPKDEEVRNAPKSNPETS